VTGNVGVVIDGTGGVSSGGTWTAGVAGSVVPPREGVAGEDAGGGSAGGGDAAGVAAWTGGALGTMGTRDRDDLVVDAGVVRAELR
jgi:hypothetical protein